MQDEKETTSDRLQDETESRKKMADKLSHERHQSQKEKEGTQEVGLPTHKPINSLCYNIELWGFSTGTTRTSMLFSITNKYFLND